MTDKEKAKAYDEALEQATKELNTCGSLDCDAARQIFRFFPILKENEDERIIKNLRTCLHCGKTHGMVNDDEYLVCKNYLEKQKELSTKKTPAWMPKFLDELRSKNHYFDWDEHRDIEGSILAIIDFIAPDYFTEKDKKEQKPTEKQDYSGLTDFERAIHRGFLCAGVENVPVEIIKETAQDCLAHIEQKPDTRDADDLQLLGFEEMTPEEKMNHPLYLEGFDVGKEVGMVVGKQEHKWSAEDESNLKSCIGKIEIDMQQWGNHGKTMVDGDIKLIDWLKSLPERFNLQPKQEWSEDDEIIRDSIIDYINSGNIYATSKVNMITWLECLRPQQLEIDVEKLVDWAKSNFRISSFDITKIVTDFSNMTELSDSLREYAYTVFRPQSSWKPSEEQMDALKNAAFGAVVNGDGPYLRQLYNELKKL